MEDTPKNGNILEIIDEIFECKDRIGGMMAAVGYAIEAENVERFSEEASFYRFLKRNLETVYDMLQHCKENAENTLLANTGRKDEV